MISCRSYFVTIARLALLAAAITLASCNNQGDASSPQDEQPAAAAHNQVPTFESAEEVIDFLRSIDSSEAHLAALNLYYGTTRVDEMTTRFIQSIGRARYNYALAVQEHFDVDEPMQSLHERARSLAQGLQETTKEPLGESRVLIHYMDSEGQQRTMLLVNARNRWRIHSRSLNDGEPLSGHWYFARMNGFARQLKHHRDVTKMIRAGEFEDYPAAAAHLQELLETEPADPGMVQLDPLPE